MSLSNADRLGPYEILSKLGEGAMGEVYRARDTRLGREVALKVIIDEVARDPSRLQRFEREARAVAALNHPNIVSLFDVGEANGTAYFVTELVQGQSLRTWLERGKPSLRKVLDVAAQVAEGLAAAHAAGITHRDLKPENMMVTEDGRVKILDFGIARRSATAEDAHGDATLPTDQTAPGSVMGTPNYMSPEQVQGGTLDHRSDQFSFGVMLYEMLAGRRAFDRPDWIQTMCAIVNEDAPPLPEAVPAPLSWIAQRCLNKDARRRYASTQDLAHALHDLRDHFAQNRTSTGEIMAPPIAARVSRWKPAMLAGAGVLLVTLAAGGVSLLRPRQASLSNFKFTPFATDPAGQCCAVWSPDGRAVAYIASPDETPRLFIRYLNAQNPNRLPDIPRLMAEGGVAGWLPERHRIIAATEDGKGIKLWSVPEVGGEPELIETPKIGKRFALAPDGKSGAVFMKAENERDFTLWSFQLPGQALRHYSPAPFATGRLESSVSLAFSPDGKKLLMIFFAEGKRHAWMVRWTAGSGAPKEVLAQLAPMVEYYAQFTWMPDSRHIILAPVTGSVHSRSHLYLADTQSDRVSQITMGTGSEVWPSMPPRGEKLIFEDRETDLNIVSVSLAGGQVTNLIATAAAESMPAWSRRGNRLAYVEDRNGTLEIWAREPDGTTHQLIPAKDLPAGCISPMNPTLSPGGQRIIYTCKQANKGFRLFVASVQGGVPPIQLTRATSAEQPGGAWSPDGKWFAYLEYSAKQPHLMKVDTNGEGTPIELQRAAFCLPDWSPAGEWISYRQEGWNLTSPDGKATKKLGELRTPHVTFSEDGKTIWFIRDQPQLQLISLDIETHQETVVANLGLANRPASDYNNSFIRFSLSPDGKSLVYTTARNDRRNLWMLEGFPQRPFGGIFH